MTKEALVAYHEVVLTKNPGTRSRELVINYIYLPKYHFLANAEAVLFSGVVLAWISEPNSKSLKWYQVTISPEPARKPTF